MGVGKKLGVREVGVRLGIRVCGRGMGYSEKGTEEVRGTLNWNILCVSAIRLQNTGVESKELFLWFVFGLTLVVEEGEDRQVRRKN